jgi:sorbitol-6-phosphate 2-dehydrogenase
MECFTKNLLLESASVIRGLTFDGRKGLFVHTLEAGKPELVFSPVSEGDGVKETALRWQRELTAFCKDRQHYPASVGIEGQKVVYGLGTNYDEAARAQGVSVLYGLEPSCERNDVVTDTIALVTGGAQGFGEGIVRSLSERGAFVYIADRNEEGARQLADRLNEEACITVAQAIGVDVTDERSVMDMMETVVRSTGGLDLFVSNAGVLKAGSVKTMSLRDFRFVTDVDYIGFFLCTKACSTYLALQNLPSGSYFTDLVAVSSKSGLQGSNRNGAYAGAKFGVIGLVQSFALELVEDNIKVNALCPGNFLDGPLWSDPKSGLFVQYLASGKVPGAKTVGDVREFYESKVPMKRGCRSEDVMKALYYVVEQNYETGQAIPITGGQVMLN